eukprot:CAMPEP_0184663354 /NCGR_PEP_ID=MMETSP0308-20130426/47863_1 /TAXON_ID=38269 /ORGANISM="Gloeochaete witrockiana, Strain SAG 46.84" /LENGTH=105 /DNA_ID=CAMNT_0027106047 /DNA_START=115 /DNA_END=432 /DNA_ORIENTATION=-
MASLSYSSVLVNLGKKAHVQIMGYDRVRAIVETQEAGVPIEGPPGMSTRLTVGSLAGTIQNTPSINPQNSVPTSHFRREEEQQETHELSYCTSKVRNPHGGFYVR